MSTQKKNIRRDFRNAVFKRFSCKICGFKPPENSVIENHLDAHHITDRHDMPYGGYVSANGISLCKVGKNCHLKAERKEIKPETLYNMINSSVDKAIQQSNMLLGDLS